MSKTITTAERLVKARNLIQKAYKYPVSDEMGRSDLTYIAEVNDILRQAKDLIKFIPLQPTTTPEIKKEVEAIFSEIEQAKKDLLRG
jgi:hypothetical protein